MNSPRKKSRIKMYAALLMMYTLAVMEAGKNGMAHFTRIMSMSTPPPPLLLETTRSRTTEYNSKQPRRLSDIRNGLNGKVIDESKQGENDFIHWFEDTLVGNSTSSTFANNFAALILKGDAVYCRKSQMKNLSRARYFVQMLQQGLRYQKSPSQEQETSSATRTSNNDNNNGLFPILIKHDDSNGCHPATRKDKYGFPRLTWSMPANGSTTIRNDFQHLPTTREREPSSLSWCSAIGMPSYKTWRDVVKNSNNGKEEIQNIHRNNNAKYPWSAKLHKAVWRGSTTSNKGMYGHLPLEEIPRSKLVQTSLDRPDLIDAGFHKVVGKYEEEIAMNGSNSRMLKDAIPLEDMMKYKAIIDIDGNNWSARFHSLLCTNSVIIKIAPDFIEQYYNEIEPNVHYISTTLGNLTHVMEDVLDDRNEVKMRGIVKKANEWCQRSRRKEVLAVKAVGALEMYRDALSEYHADGHWMEEWESGSVLDSVDDLVECNV